MATYPAIESQTMSALNADRILIAEELLEAAERAQGFTGAAGAMIALRRGDEIIVRTSCGVAPEVGTSFGPDDNIIGKCLRTAKPREYTSDLAETVKNPLLSALGVRSVASVPIMSDGTVRAVLAVFSQMPTAFSRTHIAILMTMRDVIGAKLERAAVPCPGTWVEAPAPRPEAQTKPQPAPEAAPVESEPAARTSQPAVAPPPPTTTASQLLKLVEEPPPAPIEPDPGLLGPGEDPGKYRREPMLSATLRPMPVPVNRPLVMAPALAPKRLTVAMPALAVETTSAEIRGYAEAAQSRRSLNIKVLAGIGVVILLAAALGVYWSKHETPKAPEPAAATVEAPPAAVNPAPVSMTIEAAPLKPAPAAKPAESSRPPVEKPAVVPEKVATAPLQLAPAAPNTKPAAEAPGDAPTLAMSASNAAMPELLSPKAPAAALDAKHSVVVPATLAESRPPVYPEVARRMGLQGSVKLHVSIAANGNVTEVRVLSGETLLRQASINAVRQWRYRPATLDGRPVESAAEVVLTFKAPR